MRFFDTSTRRARSRLVAMVGLALMRRGFTSW
jgi:hypothetical protein